MSHPQPLVAMFGHEAVVGQVWVTVANAVDFGGLPRTERFLWIETPNTFQQPLAAEHFQDSGKAAGERVSRIEHDGIRIRNGGGGGKQIGVGGAAGVD